MWSRFLIVLSVIVPCILANTELLSNPGKVFFWSYGAKSQQAPQYVTKSMDIPQALSTLNEIGKNYELVVILHPNEQTDLTFLTKEATNNGKNVQVFNYVYPTSGKQQEIAPSLQNFFERSQQITPDTFQEKHSTLLDNQLTDYIQIVGHGNELSNIYQTAITNHLTEDMKSKILFVSYEEVKPSNIPILNTNNHASRRLLGEYSRILSTVTYSSDIIDGVYYKPEGSEYSIYYADTYLYITPDIFTGIMTGLFIFFTVLIGMTCLGSIQGMSSFYDKIPVVGREA
mmetsp:Transcript_1301/g.1366  ORF Transcript_1301/g.1366 Transcript_1301/m.1366 type:complete len:286 (+) Transcript_1301:144-1001(+)